MMDSDIELCAQKVALVLMGLAAFFFYFYVAGV